VCVKDCIDRLFQLLFLFVVSYTYILLRHVMILASLHMWLASCLRQPNDEASMGHRREHGDDSLLVMGPSQHTSSTIFTIICSSGPSEVRCKASASSSPACSSSIALLPWSRSSRSSASLMTCFRECLALWRVVAVEGLLNVDFVVMRGGAMAAVGKC